MGQGATCEFNAAHCKSFQGVDSYCTKGPSTECQRVRCSDGSAGCRGDKCKHAIGVPRGGSWHELVATKERRPSDTEVDISGRDLEVWLQNVLGQKCREAKWANEDHGLFALPAQEAEKVLEAKRREVRSAEDNDDMGWREKADDAQTHEDADEIKVKDAAEDDADVMRFNDGEEREFSRDKACSSPRPSRPYAFRSQGSSGVESSAQKIAGGLGAPLVQQSLGDVLLRAQADQPPQARALPGRKTSKSTPRRQRSQFQPESGSTPRTERSTPDRRGRRPLSAKDERASQMMLW